MYGWGLVAFRMDSLTFMVAVVAGGSGGAGLAFGIICLHLALTRWKSQKKNGPFIPYDEDHLVVADKYPSQTGRVLSEVPLERILREGK